MAELKKTYEKEVEFEQDEELATLAVPRRKESQPDSVIAKELVKHKVVPTGTHANYVLIALSILCLTIALIFFALFIQTPPYIPKDRTVPPAINNALPLPPGQAS